MRILTTSLIILLLASPAFAQKSREDIKDHPGYFDFGDLDKFANGEEIVEVDLTQPLLSFVGSLASEEEPELADLLSELHLVNVKVFSYDSRDEDDLRDHMENIAEKLRGENWENIVRVRGRDNANVFVKLEGDEDNLEEMEFTGLAVLVLEDEEAIFVNVVGNFGMDDISRVGSHFDIPHMGKRDRDEWRRRHGDDDDHDGSY